jgi:hypothetical protein
LISTSDWLVTEAVRIREEHHGRRDDDEAAMTVARLAGGDANERLAARARALPGSEKVRSDIERVRGLLRKLLLGMIVIGLAAGWLAARASTGAREIDILLSLVTLLGLPTLMLVLWAMLLLATRRSGNSASLIGKFLVAGVARLAPRVLKSDLAREVGEAMVGLLRGPVGRWYLSMMSHLFWLAYVTGALLTLTLLFSVAQYELSWGTTILSEQTIVTLVGWLAVVPVWLGLIAPPDPSWIAAGRAGELVGPGRAIWAHFLLAMVSAYGAGPRLLFGLLCCALAWRATRRLRLDLDKPGYQRLLPLLSDSSAEPVIHGTPPASQAARKRRRPKKASGLPVVVGIELERDNDQWPPSLPGLEVTTLGRIETRSQRQPLIDALKALKSPPPALIALCSMLRTPDAGTRRLLESLADAADTELVVVVEDSTRLRSRGGDRAARLADWRTLAEQAGGRAVELDADQPSATGIAELHQLIGGTEKR